MSPSRPDGLGRASGRPSKAEIPIPSNGLPKRRQDKARRTQRRLGKFFLSVYWHGFSFSILPHSSLTRRFRPDNVYAPVSGRAAVPSQLAADDLQNERASRR